MFPNSDSESEDESAFQEIARINEILKDTTFDDGCVSEVICSFLLEEMMFAVHTDADLEEWQKFQFAVALPQLHFVFHSSRMLAPFLNNLILRCPIARLSFEEIKFEDNEADSLQNALQKNCSVKNLDFKSCSFSSKIQKAIWKGVGSNKFLQGLAFYRCEPTDGPFFTSVNVPYGYHYYLNPTFSPLFTDCITEIRECFQKNKCLNSVAFGNDITDTTAIAIFDGLKNNGVMDSLFMFSILNKSLCVNYTIPQNTEMFKLLDSILECLKANRALKYLTIGYLNHIRSSNYQLDPYVRRLFENIIRSKPSLKMLTFSNLDRFQSPLYRTDFSDIGELHNFGGFGMYSKIKHQFPLATQHGLSSTFHSRLRGDYSTFRFNPVNKVD